MVTYRSKIHSPLEADPTKYRTDVLSPLDANPVKYRSRENSPLLAAWEVPLAGLWGWFKHDEESGITIIDYSPLAMNGELVNYQFNPPTQQQIDYFWNTNPGFGTTHTHPDNFARSNRLDPSLRHCKYTTIIAFIKPLSLQGTFQNDTIVCLGEHGMLTFGWSPTNPYPWRFMSTTNSNSVNVAFGSWYCVYCFRQESSSNAGMYIRQSGDSGWTTVFSSLVTGAASQQRRIFTASSINNTAGVKLGDCLWWADETSIGLKSMSEATTVFNALKARYGMS